MTTVRLRSETKKKLDLLKEELNAKSFDELFDKMAFIVGKKISMYGADGDLGGWTEELRNEIRKDRY